MQSIQACLAQLRQQLHGLVMLFLKNQVGAEGAEGAVGGWVGGWVGAVCFGWVAGRVGGWAACGVPCRQQLSTLLARWHPPGLQPGQH